MNITIFAIATIVNVTLSTIRAICTIKCGKTVSALTNALCYGFYPLIVMLTAQGTVSIVANMVITAVVNFVCVWLIKLVEEKAKKDKMWKVEVACPRVHWDDMHMLLKEYTIPHHYVQVGRWTMFNCYCMTQRDTQVVVDLAKKRKCKISAYESKPLI